MGVTTRLQPDAGASGTVVDGLPAPPEIGDVDVRIAERATLLATRILPPYEPATLREKIHASLQRPGLARVDVLHLHQWNKSALRPDTVAARRGVVADGLFGASATARSAPGSSPASIVAASRRARGSISSRATRRSTSPRPHMNASRG